MSPPRERIIWKIGDTTHDLTRRTLVMGILNVTPDSFFDGGRYATPLDAIRRGVEMENEGADIIDLGGESTRPGADPVSESEELRRVLPVLEGLKRRVRCLLSIDTTKAAVARAALEAGADIVNDISGLTFDPAMAGVVGGARAAVVIMHRQGTPKIMQRDPRYSDVVIEVRRSLLGMLHAANGAGIHRDRIALDPGIGFGKTVEHNLALLREASELVPRDRPLLFGVSRKSFIGAVQESAVVGDRYWSGIALAAWLSGQGARVLRVHDVRATVEAVRMMEAIQFGMEAAA